MRWMFATALLIAACSNRASQSKLEPAQAIELDGGGSASDGSHRGQQAKSILGDAGGGAPDADRSAKPIGIHLRSSPSGAKVAVDGVAVGKTPTFWRGVADGREHAFTFTLAAHQAAHYRFVPVSSGVIHGRLVPLDEVGNDAGVPATSAR